MTLDRRPQLGRVPGKPAAESQPYTNDGGDQARKLALAEEPSEPPSIAEQLAEVPPHVVLWPEVDLAAEDPTWVPETGRRLCIATRRAGGRCLAVPGIDSVLCNAHAGRLDSSAGGRALAEQRRQARTSAEDRAAWARLGTRGVIAQRLSAKAEKVARAVDLLIDSAADGDLASAKLLVPYLNQGLGLPTERVQLVADADGADLASMRDEELQALVAARRAAG